MIKLQLETIRNIIQHYDVECSVIITSNADFYAMYNVDTNTITISRDDNNSIARLVKSLLHEIQHAITAKELGKEKYKIDYELEMEVLMQKGYSHEKAYKNNKYEKIANKFAKDNLKKIKKLFFY
jgi:hypothetical protein